MKIVASDLALQASHAALTYSESSERLRFWTGERPDSRAEPAGPSAIADISTQGRQLLSAAPGAAATGTQGKSTDPVTAAREAIENDPIIVLIRRMLMLLLGKDVLIDRSPATPAPAQAGPSATQPATADASGTPAATASEANWGLEYDAHAVREEAEVTNFSASGTIRTADGQEIDFRLDLQMSRTFREEASVSLRAGNAVRKDPLVVNFGGTAAQLAAADRQVFSFDLNADGNKESLPLFASSSGYLALDKNGNGRIDSGRELFGPASGSGFGELARLDEDGNGWIDEGDSAFKQLSVWTPTAQGDGELRSLAELGIGALALAHAATPFALRGDGNADLGAIAASGLFLRENGTAGSLQEVDLTV